MANKNLKSIKFPDLPDTYIIPQGTVTEADLEESEGKKADAIVRTASGNIASYDDGGDLPMKSLKVNIVPKQSGSGDPSPDNVRPISGADEVNVYRSGADTSDYETITKTLPQTVYGGTLDVVSGKLTITHTKIALKDVPKATFSNYSSGYGFYTNLAGITPPMASGRFYSDPKTVSNVLKKVEGNATNTPCVQVGAGSSLAYFMGITNNVSGVTDIDSFYAWLESANVELTYPLATPTEIDLTPTEVKSLLGDNNVWSDSGTVEVEYRADTSLVINKILEALA